MILIAKCRAETTSDSIIPRKIWLTLNQTRKTYLQKIVCDLNTGLRLGHIPYQSVSCHLNRVSVSLKVVRD